MDRMRSRALGVMLAAGLAAPAVAQVVGPDGRLFYPPGMDISRGATPLEQEYERRFPIVPSLTDVPSAAPTGPMHCAAEYEPMEAIILSWTGTTGQLNISAQIARYVTTTGDADIVVVLPSAASQTSATNTLTSAGANMSRVRFVVPSNGIDTIWMRDYGPRYIYEGDCRAVVKHKYNRPTRLKDDAFPVYFSGYKRHALYELGLGGTTLVHGGGNYHLDALNRSYATRLINNENTWFTEPQIVSIWQNYQGVDTLLFTPFPTSVDSTQHLDMWMQIIADDKVMISNWPLAPLSTQAQICDAAATTMQGRGYTVYRIPAFSISGVHYTFTNMVMCNNLALIPFYTNGTVAPYNSTVLTQYQAALPGKTVVPINCDAIVGSAGVMHCIVMHVPRHRGAAGPAGGLAPTAYLRGPNGGESLTPGAAAQIRWISDDDVGVSTVDLLLSTDGGATFPTTIASAIADSGTYTWTVPGLNTASARIRVVARDAQGNTGSDDSDANFTIGTPAPECYANCDGSTVAPVLNVADFNCFLGKFAAGEAYANCDGSTAPPVLNVADFNCFLSKFAAGCR